MKRTVYDPTHAGRREQAGLSPAPGYGEGAVHRGPVRHRGDARGSAAGHVRAVGSSPCPYAETLPPKPAPDDIVA